MLRNFPCSINRIAILFLATFLCSNSLWAQPHKNLKNTSKKTVIPIPSLNAKLVIDTTDLQFPEKGNADFSLVYVQKNDEYGFRMNIFSETILTIEDKKQYYIGEKLSTIGGKQYLESHADSSSLKLNNMNYWFEEEVFREVPLFWTEMKNKTKLTSKEMTAYLKSDKDSWDNGEYFSNFYLDKDKNHVGLRVSVFYFKEDEPYKNEIKKKCQEILTGFSFLPNKK